MSTDPRIRLEHVACALCGADTATPVLSAGDNEHDLTGTFTVVRCDRCGHAYLEPRPTPESIGVLYPDEYGAFATGPAIGGRARLRRRYARLVQFGERGSRRSGDLLELGCGTGANLADHRDRGWRVRGIEPSASAVEIARRAGLDIEVGTDEAVEAMPAGAFDEIHALMVLEHVPDPIRTLERLHRVARDDARLVVSVPNFASWSRRAFGSDWFPLQLPRHFHHFDRRTLRDTLERGGWEVERVWYQPTVADVTKSLRLRWRGGRAAGLGRIVTLAGKLADVALLPVLAPLAQWRGTSRMTVIAHRGDRPPQ